MALRGNVIRGISDFGAVRGGTPADVTFGKTAPNGLSIAFNASNLEVESGQSTFLEDCFATSVRVEVTARLLYANLVTFQEVLGVPSSALTGDLSAGTPTQEVLSIDDTAIGSRYDKLYAITPGAVSTRRFDFARCKAKGNLTIEASRDQHIIAEGVWAVLRPTDGVSKPVKITDAL